MYTSTLMSTAAFPMFLVFWSLFNRAFASHLGNIAPTFLIPFIFWIYDGIVGFGFGFVMVHYPFFVLWVLVFSRRKLRRLGWLFIVVLWSLNWFLEDCLFICFPPHDVPWLMHGQWAFYNSSSFEYTWGLSHSDLNKLVHSLNGNIFFFVPLWSIMKVLILRGHVGLGFAIGWFPFLFLLSSVFGLDQIASSNSGRFIQDLVSPVVTWRLTAWIFVQTGALLSWLTSFGVPYFFARVVSKVPGLLGFLGIAGYLVCVLLLSLGAVAYTPGAAMIVIWLLVSPLAIWALSSLGSLIFTVLRFCDYKGAPALERQVRLGSQRSRAALYRFFEFFAPPLSLTYFILNTLFFLLRTLVFFPFVCVGLMFESWESLWLPDQILIPYLQERFWLSVMIFFSSLLGFWWIIWAMVFVALALTGFGLWLLWVSEPESLLALGLAFTYTYLNYFLEHLAWFYPVDLRLTRRVQLAFINATLFARSHRPNGREAVRVLTLTGRVFVLGPRDEPSDLADFEIDCLFWQLASTVYPATFFAFWVLLFLGVIAFAITRIVLPVGKLLFRSIRHLSVALFLSVIPWLLPSVCFDVAYTAPMFLYYRYFPYCQPFVVELCKIIRMLGLARQFGLDYITLPGQASIDQTLFNEEHISKVFRRSFPTIIRRSVLRLVETLDSIRLPEMVQAAYQPVDLDSLRSTYLFLADMGVPVDESFLSSLSRPEGSAYLAEWGSYKKYLLATTNWARGFSFGKGVTTHSWLPKDFFPEVPGYIHTSTYTGIAEEILSTARYWTGNNLEDLEDFDQTVEDLWEAVKPQFSGSKLTEFETIYKGWVKSYNFGFGVGKVVNGKVRQATRQAVIDKVGGKEEFLKLWRNTFLHGQSFQMPSPVFTKAESLKLKKVLTRSVRTVVGSAFVHHVLTTPFNYQPNHNYRVWEVPMKVGMPINGQNFNRLWESLKPFQYVWAGDMTAFDSTQAPVMLRIVAECRKRGYSLHKDYHKIAQLIDVTYEMLIKQPLGFKNFGDIATKHQGATTGHSSTSSDNSLMLVCNYLYAWRHVTGLRAREFFNFNVLANFGDDHVLGYDAVFGWSPEAAIKAMASLGTIMRDESPGQHSLPSVGSIFNGERDQKKFLFGFLAKKPLALSPDVLSELKAAGVTVPLSFATCHDKDRLLGKLKGQLLVRPGVKGQLASYAALLSYMDLCAHHKDVYELLSAAALGFYREHENGWKAARVPPKQIPSPPTYNQVLRKWYSTEPFPYLEGDGATPADDLDRDLSLQLISSPDTFGIFVRWISDFPTLLSPRYTNARWADWVQRKLARSLSWPLTFVHLANQSDSLEGARYLLARTPYAFLRNDTLMLDNTPFSVLWLRHILFMGLMRAFTYRKFFSPLDLLRVFDSFWVNACFVLTGRVSQVLVELDLHILDSLVIYLLSYVTFDIGFQPISFDLLSPTILAGRLFSYILRWATPSGSIDFQNFDAALQRLSISSDYSFGMSAPTGVGKSTRMIVRICAIMKRRIIVIVPRRLLAISVGEYMQKTYPDSGIGISTEGYTPSQDCSIIYCTGQSFMSSANLRRPGSVVIVDEAHIEEPIYVVIRSFLRQSTLRHILVSATLPEIDLPVINIPAINQNRIIDLNRDVIDLAAYEKTVISFVNSRASLEKILVFVPTIKMGERICAAAVCNSCLISSRSPVVDVTASLYVSTSVSDAGLTIPDVEFVISSNIDVAVHQVTTPTSAEILMNAYAKNRDSDVIPYFYKISDTVRIQRRGRTGRTCDGTFLFFTVLGCDTEGKFWNVGDFLTGLLPALNNCIEFLPGYVSVEVFPNLVAKAAEYDKFPSVTFADFLGWVDAFPRYSLTDAGRIIQEMNVQGSWARNYSMRGPHRAVDNPPDRPPFVVSSDFDSFVDEPEINMLARAKAKARTRPLGFKRITPPGFALMQGLRVVQGLIFSHFIVALDIEVLHDMFQEDCTLAGPDGNVDPGVLTLNSLVMILMKHFALYPTLFSDSSDALMPMPQAFLDLKHPLMVSCYVYVSDSSFSYLGKPIPESTPRLSAAESRSFSSDRVSSIS
jgi:hypothetical protein